MSSEFTRKAMESIFSDAVSDFRCEEASDLLAIIRALPAAPTDKGEK